MMILFSVFKPLGNADFPDSDFIDAVRKGGAVLERATGELIDFFQGYPLRFRQKYGLDLEEAIDAYTDAILKLIRKIRMEGFDQSYRLSTLVYKITEDHCRDCLRRKNAAKRRQEPEDRELLVSGGQEGIMSHFLMQESFSAVLDMLDKLRGKCKEIILRWGYWGYSMKEIAAEVGLKNSNVAKAQKNRCIGRLREGIQKDPDFPYPVID